MPDIVVIGGGGHAKVIISLLKQRGDYRIVGYTDKENRGPVLGIPCLGGDEVLSGLTHQGSACAAAIGLGTVGRNDVRKAIQVRLEALGFALPALVSRDAIMSEAVGLGQATVVCNGAVVNSGTRIGDCSILNTHCTVDHDGVIGHHVHIAPGATLCGQVNLGDEVFVGAGATVIHGVTICPRCIIGAGAVVIADCVIPGTYVGVPARRVK